jgi:hypothetical protein
VTVGLVDIFGVRATGTFVSCFLVRRQEHHIATKLELHSCYSYLYIVHLPLSLLSSLEVEIGQFLLCDRAATTGKMPGAEMTEASFARVRRIDPATVKNAGIVGMLSDNANIRDLTS